MKAVLLLLIIISIVLVSCTMEDGTEFKIERGKHYAIFAGGCFWCMEGPFEAEPGVLQVHAGYTGGAEENPTYTEVSAGQTSHREAIVVEYDPETVDYAKLVELYFWQIDPTDPDGQFADKGYHYTTAIYYFTDEQRDVANEHIRNLTNSGKFDKPIVTEVLKAKAFYLAEEYHQDYYKKAPLRYNAYSELSGRKPFIKRVWGNK